MFIGYIYKITGVCGKVYIGSTTNYKSRISSHLSNSNNTSSRFLEKPLVFEIIRQEEFINRNYMRLIEQNYIDNIDCVNTNRAIYKYEKVECIYCKKLINKNCMKLHHQSKVCRWAREGREFFDLPLVCPQCKTSISHR